MSIAVSAGFGLPKQALRDVDAEELNAINESIARFDAVGQQPTEHLLRLKREIEAKIAREGGFEHAAADVLPERAVRRGPGRPRKPTDDDRATCS